MDGFNRKSSVTTKEWGRSLQSLCSSFSERLRLHTFHILQWGGRQKRGNYYEIKKFEMDSSALAWNSFWATGNLIPTDILNGLRFFL